MTNDEARMTKTESAPDCIIRHSDFVRHSSFVIRHSRNGFTFVEVLAALLFLAILVPAIVSGLTVANRASVMAERSTLAGELADNKLNELLIDNAWTTAETRGDFGSDRPGYRWELNQATWSADSVNTMTELRLDAFFTVQGREHSVRFSTLVSQPSASPTPSPTPASS
jgi:type II secretory pathway pseudopilin PulG